MDNILILIVGTGGVIGAVGGAMSIISYFSPSSISIRKSNAIIKENQSWETSLNLLLKWKLEAEKKIETLEQDVEKLLKKDNRSQRLISAYRMIVSSNKSCKHNKDNTDDCPVAIKMRALDIENKQE